jgi:hypothetical protein
MRAPAPVLLVVAWWLAAVSGCGSPQGVPADEGANHLDAIARAYIQYANAKGRPPDSAEDLKSMLPEQAATADFFQSSRDGKPFVILWGVDPREGMGIKPLVIGYEEQGRDGIRYVFTAMGVMVMDRATFAAASFPPGHQPPK